jgi:hypothetical protein
MLRQRVKGNESDRYISARSVERDKMIEKYRIKDDKGRLLILYISKLPFNRKSILNTES